MKWFSLLALAGVYACGDGGASVEHGSEPPITESSPPYAEWSLTAAPVTRIGAVDGPPEYQLFRVAYAGRLTDGRIVVFDGASSELRWFGPDGRFQSRSGGRGEGPGEFLSVVSATVTPQDSVVLYDFRNQRLTWFGPGGAFARTIRAELHPMVTLAPLQDARVAVAEERPTFNLGGDEYNYARDSILVMVTASASPALDTLVQRTGREAATWVQYTDGAPTGTRQFGLPFSHPTLVGSAGGRIVTVPSGGSELRFVTEEDEIFRLARRTDVDPPPLSDELREEYVKNAVRVARERGSPELLAEAGAEGLLAVIPEGQRLPSFDRMLTDPVGDRIWVRDYQFEWNAGEPQRWTVYDPIGRVLARMTTPPGLDVQQVGPDHVIGVERDEVGVEYVVVYSFSATSCEPKQRITDDELGC